MTSFDSLQILWIEERCRVNEAISYGRRMDKNECRLHPPLSFSKLEGWRAHFLTVGLSFAGAGGKNKYSFKCGLQPKPSHRPRASHFISCCHRRNVYGIQPHFKLIWFEFENPSFGAK